MCRQFTNGSWIFFDHVRGWTVSVSYSIVEALKFAIILSSALDRLICLVLILLAAIQLWFMLLCSSNSGPKLCDIVSYNASGRSSAMFLVYFFDGGGAKKGILGRDVGRFGIVGIVGIDGKGGNETLGMLGRVGRVGNCGCGSDGMVGICGCGSVEIVGICGCGNVGKVGICGCGRVGFVCNKLREA
ncbi:hypothetical protein Tco_1386043 [Tanacetum coccineum]